MVNKCICCGVEGNEVRLFDSIFNGRISKICERCSIIENIPLIKKPNAFQLKESEKNLRVYDRLRQIKGIVKQKAPDSFFREDQLKKLESNPLYELPEKEKLSLIEHFHWEIMKNRRRKGLSQRQLAELIGESEMLIQMIEKENLPENPEVLIRKLEQFFQIKLRKPNFVENYLKIKERGPVLLDESGNRLEKIPEKEIKKIPLEEGNFKLGQNNSKRLIFKEEVKEHFKDCSGLEEVEKEKFKELELEEKQIKGEKEINSKDKYLEEGLDYEKGEFDITKVDLENVNINDLRKLNRKRIEVTKQEKKEEQRRIEEKQGLIEARREELRLIKKRQSKEIDDLLGGIELLKTNLKEKELEKKELEGKELEEKAFGREDLEKEEIIEEFEEKLI